MTEIVKYLFKSFVLLRDLVGYLIPGLAFLALADPDRAWSFLGTDPGWVLIAAALLLSYAIAQVLAAAGFSFMAWRHPSTETPEMKAERYTDLMYYSTKYPDIFIESNREETVSLMRIGVSVALIFAGVYHVFSLLSDSHAAGDSIAWQSLLAWLVCVAVGIFLYWNCFSGHEHVLALERAAIRAAKLTANADAAKPPAKADAPAPPANKVDVNILGR